MIHVRTKIALDNLFARSKLFKLAKLATDANPDLFTKKQRACSCSAHFSFQLPIFSLKV